MNYQVISRKYRPQTFDEIVGQEHICTMLQNALRTGRVAHAYLFTGSRGIGKTSTARILAKTLNCANPQNYNPCNVCQNCQEIAGGRSLDVVEIDGASNRGIDQIRELRENVKYPPSSGKYRVFIIDEVHMLTKEAFNALLKTLEEPPSHVIFIFATTEPLKVPPTIISRCQRYDFHRINVPTIVELLKRIVTLENLNISDEVLTLIAKKADGALRDAESLLEQVVAFNPASQDLTTYQQILGLIDYDYQFKIGRLIANHDFVGLIQIANEIFDKGINISEFFASLTEHWRNLLIARLTNSVAMLDLPASIQKQYAEEAANWSGNDLMRLIKLISEAQVALRTALNSRIHLEFTLLRLGAMDKTVDIQQLLESVKSGSMLRPTPTTSEKQTLNMFAGSQSSASVTTSQPIITKEKEISYKVASPAPATVATPAPAATPEKPEELSLEKISSEWETVLLRIEEENHSLGNFLRLSKPHRLIGNVLEIAFGPADDFARTNAANRAKNIEAALIAIFQKPIKIRCIQVKEVGSAPETKKPIDELTEIARDLFDGEIMLR